MRKPLGAVFLAAVLLGATAVEGRREQEWIVFGSFRGGDFSSSVHAIRPDGSGERQLSPHARGRPPSLDPAPTGDESSVYFTRGGGDHRTALWVLDTGTGEERKLTDNAMVRFNNGRMWPTPRPGHPETVAFVEEVGSKRSVVILDSSSGNRQTVVEGEFPSWSPDGTQLAYLRGGQVWIREAERENPLEMDLDEVAHPSWSPSGEALLVSGKAGDGWDVYEVSLSTGDLTRLTHTPQLKERAPAWSPTGSHLAFAARATEPADGWQNSIYVMEVVTGETREITTGRYNDTRPRWVMR